MPVDSVQDMMLAQLREISGDVRSIPKMQAQLSQLEMTLHEITAESRARGEAQGRSIDDLRLRVHEMISGLTVVSNTLQELKIDMTRRVGALESQVKAIFDTLVKTNERVGELEEKGTPGLERHLIEYREWVPWLRGVRWFILIAGGILATALVVGLLWAVGKSGVLNP